MRVESLSFGQLLDWLYAVMVERIDPEKRLEFDRELDMAPKRTADPMIPKQLHDIDMPSWWDDRTPDVNW